MFHKSVCVCFGIYQVDILLILGLQSLSCFTIQINTPLEVEGEKSGILFIFLSYILLKKC